MNGNENPSSSGKSHPPKRTELPKKGSHLAVWKYFEMKPEDDKRCEVHCKVCFSLVATPQISSISLNVTTKYSTMKSYKARNKDGPQ